ncbi:MAG: UDP-2,3-diacylglucosamine diphosphatase LpxI [Candidatus Omnitrophica bacterium]|nr:UDP-2,3-diacylglucosamine diphosphatase LpxI [Candidatus Omnitrophota bacterium]MCF7876987.1 UDP-2,3-diacylglucosamine diphosphatase LpxI [Candidatus Omnitrophota bacterium]MCF7878507.1 UDP-2,3-diacylglucosamine diphosphatase LpxI [Candidatus Omnitrophota bacterium]MCF7893160.1 UDP-2,3-diacylglucosamine diphosphatase LpxI [Candidatus Omnitrophota bacterium]
MNKQIGIVAGSKNLPLLLAKRILESKKFTKIAAICFKGETSFKLCRYADKCLWVKAGKLKDLREAIKSQKVKDWVMAGQVNPLNIFKKSKWDDELKSVAEGKINFCPHTFFKAIINHLESEGINFLDSTLYLKNDLAKEGVMNGLGLPEATKENIDFGLDKISKFVEIDIGQVLVVKNKTVVAIESLEGTDNTIKRGFKIAGPGAAIFKCAKGSQDLRFDVPVVGISTLKLAKRIQASCLVLEEGKTIILEKEKFLYLSKKWKIPVIGLKRN